MRVIKGTHKFGKAHFYSRWSRNGLVARCGAVILAPYSLDVDSPDADYFVLRRPDGCRTCRKIGPKKV